MSSFVFNFLGRIGWSTFSALVGRFVARRILHYTISATAGPYIIPFAAIGIGAAGSATVLQRHNANYPNLIGWLHTVANVTGTITVVLGVLWFVGWDSNGAIGALVGTATTQAGPSVGDDYLGLILNTPDSF